jgi:hypothetical protein
VRRSGLQAGAVECDNGTETLTRLRGRQDAYRCRQVTAGTRAACGHPGEWREDFGGQRTALAIFFVETLAELVKLSACFRANTATTFLFYLRALVLLARLVRLFRQELLETFQTPW